MGKESVTRDYCTVLQTDSNQQFCFRREEPASRTRISLDIKDPQVSRRTIVVRGVKPVDLLRASLQARRASLQGNPSLLAAPLPRPRRAPQHPLGPPAHTIVLYCLVKYPVKLITGDPS